MDFFFVRQIFIFPFWKWLKCLLLRLQSREKRCRNKNIASYILKQKEELQSNEGEIKNPSPYLSESENGENDAHLSYPLRTRILSRWLMYYTQTFIFHSMYSHLFELYMQQKLWASCRKKEALRFHFWHFTNWMLSAISPATRPPQSPFFFLLQWLMHYDEKYTKPSISS